MRRGGRPQRLRVFLGGEGASENSYGVFLHRWMDTQRRDRHLDCEDLRGGDPLAVIEVAIERIVIKERNHGAYAMRAVLLDSDGLGKQVDRDSQMYLLAARHKLRLIWQRPCHEGFLLRHLEGYENENPPTTADAQLRLAAAWPEYHKAMTASDLARKLSSGNIMRARQVVTEFDDLLSDLGL